MVWPDGPGPFKGTQQAGRWPRPLTGSARVLLLTTQVIATRSVVPGHRRIILTPLADPGGKAAIAFLPAKVSRSAQTASAVRVSWRFRRFAPGRGNVPAVLIIQLSRSPFEGPFFIPLTLYGHLIFV